MHRIRTKRVMVQLIAVPVKKLYIERRGRMTQNSFTLSIYISPLNNFMNYAEELDDLIWGFYFMRSGSTERNASLVIGLFEDELMYFKEQYEQTKELIEGFSKQEGDSKEIAIFRKCYENLPIVNFDRYKTGKPFIYLFPTVYPKRIIRTLHFQSEIRIIQAVIAKALKMLTDEA